MQHVCQNAGVDYVKPIIRRETGRMFLGRGIAWAQGTGWSMKSVGVLLTRPFSPQGLIIGDTERYFRRRSERQK